MARFARFAAIALLLSLSIFAFEGAIRLWRGGEWLLSSDVQGAKHAVEILPTNPDARTRLAEMLWIAEQDEDHAADQFTRTLELDPYNCYGLLEFATLERGRMNLDHARQLLHAASDCDRFNPKFQQSVITELYVLGETNLARVDLRRVLATGPHFRDALIRVALSNESDIHHVLALLPATQSAYEELLFIVIGKNDAGMIDDILVQGSTSGLRFTSRALLLAAEALLADQRPYEAAAAWNTLVRSYSEFAGYAASPPNLVTNPTFALPITGQGLDWHISTPSGVSITQSVPSGLTLSFHLAHLQGVSVFQTIPALSNQRYSVSVEYDCSRLVSASPLQLVVTEVPGRQTLAQAVLDSSHTELRSVVHTDASATGITIAFIPTNPTALADGSLSLHSASVAELR